VQLPNLKLIVLPVSAMPPLTRRQRRFRYHRAATGYHETGRRKLTWAAARDRPHIVPENPPSEPVAGNNMSAPTSPGRLSGLLPGRIGTTIARYARRSP